MFTVGKLASMRLYSHKGLHQLLHMTHLKSDIFKSLTHNASNLYYSNIYSPYMTVNR